jgi:hypothetical protein
MTEIIQETEHIIASAQTHPAPTKIAISLRT